MCASSAACMRSAYLSAGSPVSLQSVSITIRLPWLGTHCHPAMLAAPASLVVRRSGKRTLSFVSVHSTETPDCHGATITPRIRCPAIDGEGHAGSGGLAEASRRTRHGTGPVAQKSCRAISQHCCPRKSTLLGRSRAPSRCVTDCEETGERKCSIQITRVASLTYGRWLKTGA